MSKTISCGGDTVFSENTLFINTILLGGSTGQKLQAAADAGFMQVELWQQDIRKAEGDADQVKQKLTELNLSLTDYQVLLDFDGAAESQRDNKRREALDILDTAVRLGAGTVLVPANTDAACQQQQILPDLCWLVAQAEQRGLRIAYEAMSWSTFINTLPRAMAILREIDSPALGLVIDAFHIFALQRTSADLQGIPMDKIFLVQLSDAENIPERQHLTSIARHERLLPGEGVFPLKTLIDYLSAQDYQGPIGLEVFNDHLKSQDPQQVARAAFRSLIAVLDSNHPAT
ncbi:MULTISPECIES: sugar phosphate isomerase/epimerase family protein [Tatumella]|uniref:Sugar phosphate isomerase/epimerase family protein n=1 Tax=Tatumella punctata TaxID=399969 RepID=A0ABW1VPB6_9GAMM|nr:MULTISPECIES: sugar phosphate isomerase/epimerase family protein [unclassified Tatumella]